MPSPGSCTNSCSKTRFVVFPNFDDLEAFVNAGYITRAQAGVFRVPCEPQKFSPCLSHVETTAVRVLVYQPPPQRQGGAGICGSRFIIRQKYPGAEFHIIGPCGREQKLLTITAKTSTDGSARVGWSTTTSKRCTPYIADADCVVMPSYREG